MGSKHIPKKEWCAVTQLDPMDDSAETSTLRLQDVRVYPVEAARPEPPKTAPEPNIKSKGTAPGTLLAIPGNLGANPS